MKFLFGDVVFWQKDISLSGYEELISSVKIITVKQKNNLKQESLLILFRDGNGQNLIRKNYGSGLSFQLSGSFFCGETLTNLAYFSARSRQKCQLDNQQKKLTISFADSLLGIVLIPIARTSSQKSILIKR